MLIAYLLNVQIGYSLSVSRLFRFRWFSDLSFIAYLFNVQFGCFIDGSAVVHR